LPEEAIFPQEYSLYFKGKWRSTGQKEPLIGRFDSFQIHSNNSHIHKNRPLGFAEGLLLRKNGAQIQLRLGKCFPSFP